MHMSERDVLPGSRKRRGLTAAALAASLSILIAVTTVAPAAASTVFADGFESGDLSGWTANVGLIAEQHDVFAGAWAARAQGDASPAFAYEQLPSPSLSLTAETWFNVIGRSTRVGLLRLETATGSNLVTLSLNMAGELAERNDVSGVTTTTSVAPANSVWHHLVVQTLINGTASHVDVVLDDATIPQISNTESLGTAPLGRLRLGDGTTSHVFDVAFDEVLARVPDDVDPPTQPQALTAGSVSASAIALTWSPSQDNTAVADYTVYRSDSGAPSAPIATVTTTSFNDTTVSPSTSYTYAVDASDEYGNRSVPSAPLEVMTPPAEAAGNPVVMWSPAIPASGPRARRPCGTN
jgi:hypothetical protein